MFNFLAFELTPTDIFALGIMLFMMRCGALPFEFAKPSDDYYKYLHNNRPDLYWEAVSANKINEEGVLTEDFKVLIEGMLKRDPKERYTIADIKDSKWYKGEIADKKAIEEEFELLRATLADIYQEEEKERIEKRKQRAKEQAMATWGISTETMEEETKKDPNARVYVRQYRSISSRDV